MALNNLIFRLEGVVENRMVKLRSKKLKPRRFALVLRDLSVLCIWSGNIKVGDIIICEFYNPENGFEYKEWEAMAVKTDNTIRKHIQGEAICEAEQLIF